MAEPKIKLRAADGEDLSVIASLLQDAIVSVGDIALLPSPQTGQQFALILSRFCWEKDCAERVHSALVFNHVQKVQYRGIDRETPDMILNLLTIKCEGTESTLFFAGGGTIKIEADRMSCVLQDMDQPWPTHFVPCHDAKAQN